MTRSPWFHRASALIHHFWFAGAKVPGGVKYLCVMDDYGTLVKIDTEAFVVSTA